jgi:hypothetical protein
MPAVPRSEERRFDGGWSTARAVQVGRGSNERVLRAVLWCLSIERHMIDRDCNRTILDEVAHRARAKVPLSQLAVGSVGDLTQETHGRQELIAKGLVQRVFGLDESFETGGDGAQIRGARAAIVGIVVGFLSQAD